MTTYSVLRVLFLSVLFKSTLVYCLLMFSNSQIFELKTFTVRVLESQIWREKKFLYRSDLSRPINLYSLIDFEIEFVYKPLDIVMPNIWEFFGILDKATAIRKRIILRNPNAQSLNAPILAKVKNLRYRISSLNLCIADRSAIFLLGVSIEPNHSLKRIFAVLTSSKNL